MAQSVLCEISRIFQLPEPDVLVGSNPMEFMGNSFIWEAEQRILMDPPLQLEEIMEWPKLMRIQGQTWSLVKNPNLQNSQVWNNFTIGSIFHLQDDSCIDFSSQHSFLHDLAAPKSFLRGSGTTLNYNSMGISHPYFPRKQQVSYRFLMGLVLGLKWLFLVKHLPSSFIFLYSSNLNQLKLSKIF